MKLSKEMLSQLSQIKSNLISWYLFKESDTILEISILDEGIANNVCRNVTFVNKLQNIPDGALFDYILLEGVLENSRAIFNMRPEELINKVKSHLKNDGKLLIATDNKLGIYNLCSEQEEKNIRYLGKKKIEKILDAQGFVNRKFYYPLPNYLTPNVIFTDKHLPNLETINRNLTFYDDNTVIVLNETNRFRKILEEDRNEFKNFANSFFIECSMQQLEENNIEFVAFSNMRQPQYRIKTVIQGDKVYKYNAEEASHTHITNIKNNIDIMKQNNINTVDSYDDSRIISDYQKNVETYDEIILKELKKDNIDKAIELIEGFKNKLIDSIEKSDSTNEVFDKYNIKHTNEDIQNLHFVKYGLWDLIFKNCFYIENKFYFYDQEWIEKDIPVEFILYRAIRYFDGVKKYISENELYERVGISEKQLQMFKELDDELQCNIRDKNMWSLHLNSEIQKNAVEKIKKLEDDKEKISNECKQLLNQKDARISVLEDGMQEAMGKIKEQEQIINEKELAINAIKNSTSWKITKPLRKLKPNNSADK